MGKTTIALSVLHDPRVRNHFNRRYFVDCEGVDTLDLLYGRMADILRIPIADRTQYLLDRLIYKLRGDDSLETIICFDNFETLWEAPASGTRNDVESVLARILGLPHVTTLITKRGAESPMSLRHAHHVDRLPAPSDMDMFRDVSGGCHDEWSKKLVESADGMPLAIQLLASLIDPHIETAEDIWKRWQRLGTATASRGKERLLDLELSIELSLASPRIANNPDTYAVLALLSLLPDGLDIHSVAMERLESAFEDRLDIPSLLSQLTRFALIYRDGQSGRHRMLSPIRLFILSRHRVFCSTEYVECFAYMWMRFSTEYRDTTDSNGHKIFRLELINLHNVINWLWDQSGTELRILPRDLLDATIICADWLEYIGSPSIDIMEKGSSHCKNADELADCFYWIGRLRIRFDELNGAEASLLRAVELHKQSQSAPDEGEDHLTLGELYMRLDRLEEAETSLLRAVRLHQQSQSVLGEGSDHLRLGELYMRLDRLEEAETSLLRAVELHQQSQAILGEGTDHLRLGELYMRLDRLEEAEASLRRAVRLHQQSQHILSEGSDHLRLGELYMRLDRLEEAETSLLRAVRLHQQAQSKLDEGSDHLKLGELYMHLDRLDEANTSLLQAVGLHRQAHSIRHEIADQICLGKLYTKLNRLPEAEVSRCQAEELQKQLRHPVNLQVMLVWPEE
jgi:tetratricopeptide (TPR) repeat protein